MTAPDVEDFTREEDDSAPPVTWPATVLTANEETSDDESTETPSRRTRRRTPKSAANGSATGNLEAELSTLSEESLTSALSLTSKNSGEPTSGLSKRWLLPQTTRDFVAQSNAVMTGVLNGEIDIDRARVYGSVARVMAQVISVEVSRARFLREVPDLTLDGAVFDEDEIDENP